MPTRPQDDLAQAEVRVRLAEARKVEAEAAEIEAKTEERRLRMRLLSVSWAISMALIAFAVISVALGSQMAPGGYLFRHWLPTMLPKP